MCVNLQNMEETALFSGKIYIADKNFTRPPVVVVATNFNSGNPIIGSSEDCRGLSFSLSSSKSCHFLGSLSRLKCGSEQRISVEAKLRLLSKCPPILFPLDRSVVRVCIPDIFKQIRAI